eukprot:SM000028S10131  [mRNA]  locus=s28:554676:556877:+ [translate_table: standard]
MAISAPRLALRPAPPPPPPPLALSAAHCRAAAAPPTEGRAGSMVKVAVGQMTASGDPDANFRVCRGLALEAAAADAKLLSLPECFSFIGARDGESLARAEALDGSVMQRYQALARETGIWLALGGFQEIGPDSSHLYNSHVILDSEGSIRACYRKIHLFDLDIPGQTRLKESNSTAAGDEVMAVDSPAGRLGLTICYDLRFPELYQRLRYCEDAEILLVPSAFTKKTGEAHWEVLLRARAIECQCYVVAAAQAGRHNDRRESFGHALIIDPWDPLATGIAVADIDHDFLTSVRTNIPVEQHRRYDIYGMRRSDARM